MPRTARASAADVCYHVMNRGNGRAEVFHKRDDYAVFLELIAAASERLAVEFTEVYPAWFESRVGAGSTGAFDEGTPAALARLARAVVGGAPPAVVGPTGWVVNAFTIAWYGLWLAADGVPPAECLSRIIHLGGDTATNAAIAGGLIGAFVGEAALRADATTAANIDLVIGCDTAAGGLPRPAAYSAARLPQLAVGLARLAQP